MALMVALYALASCKSCDDAAKSSSVDAGGAEVSTAARDDHEATAGDAVAATADAASEDAGAYNLPYAEAGTSSCRLAYGPAEQPFRGPAALSIAGNELRLIANDAGKPRLYPIHITAKGAPPIAVPRPSTFTPMRWPPCEIAGRFVYCQAPGGSITRTTLSASGTSRESKTIAKSRAGSRIAAASLGPNHSVVAYLDVRRTTEGNMLQAFVVLDDQVPVRLSEEGAGATTVRFLPRGETAISVYLDTRTSMVPVHARSLSVHENDLVIGNDAVVFVGGAPERGIDFAVASAKTRGFAFVPMPRDMTDFGMATLPIDDPPKDDVAAVWSRYPNGLDPAPLAAAPARDGQGAWLVRIRPREEAVGSARILELGRVDTGGVFTSYGEIAPGNGVTDMALIEDGTGSVWILYGDATITWLERRVCG